MKKLLPIVGIIALISPFAVWAMYKPVRVLFPGCVDGITCINSDLCLEDSWRYQEAKRLYVNALRFVSLEVGEFQQKPRVIFCSTEACYRWFGFKGASASNVGIFGMVISSRGWKNYYLRHEMIHHRQVEEFGLLASLFKPEWLTEGMAYYLSGDPRHQLSDRWQGDREKFQEWLGRVGNNNLWKEARRL